MKDTYFKLFVCFGALVIGYHIYLLITELPKIYRKDIFINKIHYIELDSKLVNYTEDSINYENSLNADTLSNDFPYSGGAAREPWIDPDIPQPGNCGDQTQSH